MRLEAILAWLLCSKYRRPLRTLRPGPFRKLTRVVLADSPRWTHREKQCRCAGVAPSATSERRAAAHPPLVSQALNGLELGGAAIQVTAAAPNASLTAPVQVPEGEIDDDGQGGLNLSAASRASLMQKLQRTGDGSGAPSMLGGPAQPPMGGLMPQAAGAPGAAAVKQERTILLRNMFAPEDAKAEENFEEEMKDEIQSECSKYGRVEHVKVDKVSPPCARGPCACPETAPGCRIAWVWSISSSRPSLRARPR